jgi:protoporphyrinogen oxidase
LGAGPAGLGAALQLARRGSFDVTVLERNAEVGGNAASFDLDGQRVDFGSHRLHPSCPPEVMADIRAMLGDDLLERPRHGRIRLRGRWVHFPLQPIDLALHLPPAFAFGVARDSLFKPRPGREPETFATVLERGLGRTICRDFYFPYARKIWGVPPDQLDAEQARRRVSAGSIGKMVRKVLNAVPGLKPRGAGRFYYPRRGYGQISEAYYSEALRAGVDVRLRTSITGIERNHDLTVHAGNGVRQVRLPARQVLSTIPVPALVRLVSPPAPQEVIESACALRYRAMVLIYMTLGTDRFTEFDAHYFPGPEVAITRLSEPRNYSLEGPAGRTVLCAELPCSIEDSVWRASDRELGSLMIDALNAAGLPITAPVRRVAARRLPQAYPIYTRDYRRHFDRIDEWAGSIDGLLTFGRQGLFAHDNTHHTLAMAYAAAGCLDSHGRLDRNCWAAHRRRFTEHVVED